MRSVESQTALPVNAILPEILSSVRLHLNIVIEAPRGTGKATRVPPGLLSMKSLYSNRAGLRHGWRRGELRAGLVEIVGYQLRFEAVIGAGICLRLGRPRWQDTILARQLKPTGIRAGIGKIGSHMLRPLGDCPTRLGVAGFPLQAHPCRIRHHILSFTYRLASMLTVYGPS
jgi:hypothetical protein